MKLYLIRYTDKYLGHLLAWTGTQADAKRKYKELREACGKWNVEEPLVMEVPTSKPELLMWLNTHYNTDNG